MKIALGFSLIDGPWGGGNQFMRSLSRALESRGDQVFFDLQRNDLDLILLTDPRSRSPNVAFSSGRILRYLFNTNKRAIVVHRINECDERKNTRTMNGKLRRANYCADHTVFIASWLKELNVWRRESTSSVILNGGDKHCFKPSSQSGWDRRRPLRLVTHHWGGNWMKGFDVYTKLDQMLSQSDWSEKVTFTYIGNLPSNCHLKNTRCIAPLSGSALSEELSRHDAYITASINEPGGMHHIEGALCGLPILYRKSGAMPEYCSDFGIGFEGADFVPALDLMLRDYEIYKSLMAAYPHTSEKMCENYIRLFDTLVGERENILKRRNLRRSSFVCLREILFN